MLDWGTRPIGLLDDSLEKAVLILADALLNRRQSSQVAVGVDRGGDGLVTESCLDVRQRSPSGDQPGDVGMTEIVKPERRDPSAASAFISLRQTWV